MISSANLDTKIISLSLKWQSNVQINNCTPLWQIEQSQPFADILFTDRKCQSKRSHLHDFYWILIKEDLVFINQGNGLEGKEKCKCCVQGNRRLRSEPVSSKRISLLYWEHWCTGHSCCISLGPGACPEWGVWWHMDPFSMSTPHPLYSTHHLLWAWRS